MKTKLQIAIEALQDIRTWNEDLNDQWGDPGERAIFALNAIQEGSPKRHPSEITPDEFRKIASFFGGESVNQYKWYVQPFIASERIELQCVGYSNYFAIDWSNDGLFIYKYTLDGFVNPEFSQSLKIAAYLDSIGIEYLPTPTKPPQIH